MSVGRDMVLSVLLVGRDGVEVVEEEYHLIVTAYKKILKLLSMVCFHSLSVHGG
jgi:hypothetical protein